MYKAVFRVAYKLSQMNITVVWYNYNFVNMGEWRDKWIKCMKKLWFRSQRPAKYSIAKRKEFCLLYMYTMLGISIFNATYVCLYVQYSDEDSEVHISISQGGGTSKTYNKKEEAC